jgi:hypothetical protein
MISVLNCAAISLQVSGIARPLAPSGAGMLALHADTRYLRHRLYLVLPESGAVLNLPCHSA